MHLTLNAEYDLYRWGPITQAPSLLDGDGGFPRTVDDVWDHADLDEVRRELPGPDRAGDPVGLRRQPPRLATWARCSCGPSSSTSTSRWPSSSGCRCGCRAASTRADRRLPVPPAGRRGGRASSPTTSCTCPRGGQPAHDREALFDLRPGVTEVYVHPAADTPELRALAPDWAKRVDDHHLVVPRRRASGP